MRVFEFVIKADHSERGAPLIWQTPGGSPSFKKCCFDEDFPSSLLSPLKGFLCCCCFHLACLCVPAMQNVLLDTPTEAICVQMMSP